MTEPSAEAAKAISRLPSPAIVVFIGKVDWLFALHCGLFIGAEEGDRGRLLHASSKAGQVVAADLAKYLDEQGPRYLGFTAYAIEPMPDSPGEGQEGK